MAWFLSKTSERRLHPGKASVPFASAVGSTKFHFSVDQRQTGFGVLTGIRRSATAVRSCRPVPGRRSGLQSLQILLGRHANGFKPSADIYLSVAFTTEMPSGWACGSGQLPLDDCELRIAALDHKPMDRILIHDAANLASKFLQTRHAFSVTLQEIVERRRRPHIADFEPSVNSRAPSTTTNQPWIEPTKSSDEVDNDARLGKTYPLD